MIAELAGGIISGSLALLADAGHMLTDFGALLAAFIGVRIEARSKTDMGKRPAALIAFLSAISLYILAAIILFEAYKRFQNPAPILTGTMLGVAICGLIINLLVFRVLSGASSLSLNMRGAALHVLGDIFGSVAAIGAALLIMATQIYSIDPILSAIVALLICLSAFPLLRDSFKQLRDPTPINSPDRPSQ